MGLQDSIPVKKAQEAVPHRDAVAALIRNNREETLLIKRPDRGLLGGLWRFPGGLLAEGEAPAAGLRRILRDELGLKGTPGKEWLAVEHGYSHFSVTMHVLSCTIRGQLTDAGSCVQYRWVGAKGFSRLAVSRLERKILAALQSVRPAGKPIEDGKRSSKRVP